ncbi:MAG: hypothetical protein V2B14_00805 [bacterium]
MNKEAIKEKLIYYNSFKTNLWAAFIVLSSGLASLAVNNITKIWLYYIGVFSEIIIILTLSICIKKISMYINALNKGE